MELQIACPASSKHFKHDCYSVLPHSESHLQGYIVVSWWHPSSNTSAQSGSGLRPAALNVPQLIGQEEDCHPFVPSCWRRISWKQTDSLPC